MTLEEHVRILHDLLRRDHEEWIAEIQGWADAAAARGDAKRHRSYLDMIARYEARPKPWEPKETTTAGGAHGSGGG
jgi:hypothetical protein